ncbi:MAG: hypothetical protein Q9207_002271 [Kuettlingeria erythrocarpa]
MVDQLGLNEQVFTKPDGQQALKTPVYLPEATVQQPSSRSNSPAPQLPTLTVDFTVQASSAELNGMQIFLGCDILRARNADIHFSLDRLTLFDDERNKLSVPLVRPENANLFQNLLTINTDRSNTEVSSLRAGRNQVVNSSGKEERPAKPSLQATTTRDAEPPIPTVEHTPVDSPTAKPSVIGQGRKMVEETSRSEQPSAPKTDVDGKDAESLANGSTPDTPTRSDSSSIWGSWRRDSMQGTRPDPLSSNTSSSSGYQRAGRGRGMKVLKPARLNTSRSSSTTTAQPSGGFDATSSRFNDAGKWPSPTAGNENHEPRSSVMDRRFSGGSKSPLPGITGKPNKSNPVGGASAFGWLNSAQAKQSDSGAD